MPAPLVPIVAGAAGGGGAATAGSIAATGAAAARTAGILGTLRTMVAGAEGGFGKLVSKLLSVQSAMDVVKLASEYLLDGLKLLADGVKKLVDFLVKCTLAFAEFDAKLDGVRASSGSSAGEMALLGDRARELASSLGFDVTQAIDGLKGLADAGMNAGEQMRALGPSLQLSQVTGKSVGDAVDLMAQTLEKFHLGAGRASEVADTFAAALRQTVMSAPDLATMMGKLSDNAARSGQSLQGSIASVSILRDVFGDTATAATSFEGMLKALQEKSGELGVQVTDSSGRLLPLVDILRNMEKAGFDAAKAGETLGKEAGPTLAALLGVGSDALARLQGELRGTGQGAQVAKEATDNLGTDMKKLGAATQGIMQSIGAFFEPIAREAVQLVTRIAEAVREFIEDHSEVGTFLAGIYAGAIGLVRGLFEWFMKLPEPVKKFIAGLNLITGPIVVLHDGLKALSAIGSAVYAGWNLLVVAGYDTFGKLTKYITDSVAKALGVVKELLLWVARISEMPGVSKIPGLSGLTESVGKQAGQWAASVGQLQGQVQSIGKELEDTFHGKAEQALESYIRNTTLAMQATSAFQQSLKNKKAAADDVAAALAAAGKETKDKTEECACDQVTNVGVGVGVGVGVTVNQPRPPEPPSFAREVQAAFDAAAENAAVVEAAFASLNSAPVKEIAQKYGAFDDAVQKATRELESQRDALRKLAPEHPAVARAIAELDKALEAIGRQRQAAEPLKEISEGLTSIAEATTTAEAAIKDLDSAPLSELLTRTEAVDAAMAALDKTIADQRARLSGLTEGTDQYKSIQEELEKALGKRNELESTQSSILSRISAGTRDALEALQGYANAESAAFKVQKVAEYLAAVEKIKGEIAAAQAVLGQLKPDSEAFRSTEAYINSLKGQLGEIQKIAAGQGIETREAVDDPLKEYADIWDKFVADATGSFSDLFLNVLEGNVDSFDDFVDSIKKLFKKMLADMAAAALKKVINIPVSLGGQDVSGTTATGTVPVAGSTSGSSFNFGVFNNADNKFDLSKFLGTAAMGYGVGSIVGSFAAQEDNYAEVGAQILGVVGAIVGAVVLSWLTPQVGAMIGSVVGSVIGAVLGSMIKRGLPRATATLDVSEGRAVVDEFYTRNKGSLDQIRQYAEGVVKGINDLAALTGGILLDLPNVKLSIKNNKFFQVVDSSGITHKFGEDYEDAINFAVLLALKEAKFSGLSPEVEAAIRNSKATTIEDFASDIEFAKEVQDINLEPVTKDLRDVIRRFNEMSARARELGISLDKVDAAFSKAVDKIKEDILSGLKPFQDAGLTDVEREAKRITEAFEEMRESARLFNEELALETQSRNDEIGKLQEELVRQQELLARAQQSPEDFLPPELLERLQGRGVDPEVLTRMATAGIQEMIDKILAEIARLQGLNAAQTPIDMGEIDDAEQAARRALRDRVKDSLKPYQRLDLTQVQQQLLQLDDTFEKLRRDARAAGVSMEEVDRAYEKAREAIRKQVMDQLQPYLDLAAGMTPLQAELRELEERFKDLRTNAAELGIDPALVDTAEQAARDQLRRQFEDELAAFAGQNPFVAQLDELKDKFDELTKNAIALGLGTEQVNEAYQQALENMQKQFQDGIQGFLDYGRGLSDIAVRHRDLTRFFDEQREAARALDEAMGFTGGGGPNEQLLGEAEAAAFQQLVDDFKASLQDLRDAGLTPTEIAVRDMRDRFTQLREDAALLGLSIDELTRLEVQAIERLRGELDAQLDRYLLSEDEQQQQSFDQEFLGYLRDALALYTYEPGMGDPLEPEPFPGANELELAFADVKTASEELEHAFRLLRNTVQPDGTTPPPMEPPPAPGTGQTPGEIVAAVMDFLEPLREGRGMDELPADQRQAIDDASTQVSLLLEQLRLGMTDDVGALQGALGNLVGLLEQSGLEIDGSLLGLVDALAAGDITGFLDDLRNGVIGSADGFGALIDILLSGDVSLPDLMHQLANGTFDAIKAMLGLTELPEDLAAALQRIGQAYESGQRQQVSRRSVSRGGEASREVDQRERERDAMLNQLKQFESLALSPTEREIQKLNEQFDEMRANAGRLGISLERVEAAYQLAIEDQRKRVLSQLEPFEDLALSPAERELKALDKQFDEIRASAALLGISMERVEAAYQLALEDRRQQERAALTDQLEQFEDLALTPAERELKALNKQFDEIRANAERLGIPMERVEAAYQLALEDRRRQEREAMLGQLEQYQDLGLSPVQRELNRLNEQFDEMRANAERLGISLEEVEAAYELALQQQRDALTDQLEPYENLGLSPAQRELNQLNEQFDEMRANALLLGVSLERVEAAYQLAIEDFWERLLGPLQQFRDDLAFSEMSTLTPEQRLAEAQARFDELSALALGGDLEAAQQLQGAAQQLLQEAQSFYASGEGYQNLFALVTGTIDQILSSLPGMPGQAQPEGFDALLAGAGWGFQESLAARGIPFAAYPGDTHGEPDVMPFLTGLTAEGKPALAVDLTGVREDNLALREELRINRQQEHVDAVELQKRVDQQSEELREVRALLRRLTSNTQYGGRA